MHTSLQHRSTTLVTKYQTSQMIRMTIPKWT